MVARLAGGGLLLMCLCFFMCESGGNYKIIVCLVFGGDLSILSVGDVDICTAVGFQKLGCGEGGAILI
jgi:hypothetical protein